MNKYQLQSTYEKNPMRSTSIENYRASKKRLMKNAEKTQELPVIENDFSFMEGIKIFLSGLGVIAVIAGVLVLASWQYAGLF